MLIIASRSTTLRTPDDRLLQSPQLRAELKRINVQSIADIRLRKIGDNHTIGPLLQTIAVPPNSDYFPFVDLNAPRLRYMRENALELPALTILPIPFLELIEGGAAPQGPTLEPVAESAMFRDRLVRRALDVRSAATSGSLDNLDPASATYLSRIDMSQERCAAGAAQDTWKVAVRNISDYTTAYLTPPELTEIWHKVLSSPCYRDVPGEHTIWADLLAAVSQRDAPQIVRFGTLLLGQPSANSAEEFAYLTTVTAAAYVRMGEPEQARDLLQAQLRRFKRAGQFDFALRELVALTQSTGSAAIAQPAR
jgi:hypothetical protein